MRLEGYIREEEERIKEQQEAALKKLPEWATLYRNIEIYNLPPENLNLIRSFRNYIEAYDFNKNDSKEITTAAEQYTMIQTRPKKWEGFTGETVAFLIEKPTKFKFMRGIFVVNEKEYNNRLNAFRKVESQDFYVVNLSALKESTSSFDKIYSLFYSGDDKIFVNEEIVPQIREAEEEKLGKILAKEVIKIKQKNSQN